MKKEKMKQWWDRNKKKVYIAAGVIAGVGVCIAVVKHKKQFGSLLQKGIKLFANKETMAYAANKIKTYSTDANDQIEDEPTIETEPVEIASSSRKKYYDDEFFNNGMTFGEFEDFVRDFAVRNRDVRNFRYITYDYDEDTGEKLIEVVLDIYSRKHKEWYQAMYLFNRDQKCVGVGSAYYKSYMVISVMEALLSELRELGECG